MNAEEKILKKARDYFNLAVRAESDNRYTMREDLEFAALDQWPEEVKNQRKGRPMLVLDHIGQSIRRVLGDVRQNLPAIKIDPVDDGADKDTADVMEGLIRQIEYQSRAHSVYMQAAEMQVKCGFGAFRICTKYNEFDSFDQDILLKPIRNPFTVYFDPAAQELTRRDGRFVIVTETISHEQFEEQFGKKPDKVSFENSTVGEDSEMWYDDDAVRIAEIYVREKVKRKLLLLSDGTTIDATEIKDDEMMQYAQAGITPVKERVADSHQIKYYKVTGAEVLEESVWPGRYFPIIPVYGIEENIEGRVDYRGIVRAAKDPQRLYNYWHSAAAESIALQPKAPFIVTAKQVKNYKRFWERANVDNMPFLPYEPDGTAPPPQRQAPPTMQAGLLQQAAVAAEDIKAATGVYDASLGARSNETSGKAILARQSEAELGNSMFIHNLAAAIEQAGAVILDLIPHFYDTMRVLKIRGEDDSATDEIINAPIFTPDGIKIRNDLTRGKYDVRVSIGASYKTRRAEAAASLVELARVFPQILQVGGDLVAKNLDWPGADEIAERLRKMLPPGMAENEDPEQQQAQAQAAQQQAALEQMQLDMAMQREQAEIEAKQADAAKKMADIEAQQTKTLVDVFNAETNRMDKLADDDIESLSNEELFRIASGRD